MAERVRRRLLIDRVNYINNYVFQNKFKVYFSPQLGKVLKYKPGQLDWRVSSSMKLLGSFGNKDRVLHFPNFFHYSKVISSIDFTSIPDLGMLGSSLNYMKIDYRKRMFKPGGYVDTLEKQLLDLLEKYDFMQKIDIQGYYSNIYTHVYEHIPGRNLKQIDKQLRLYNSNKTNGILLGNVLSTLAANEVIHHLSKSIQRELLGLDDSIKVRYFSDQFYIFFNKPITSELIVSTVSSQIGKDYFEFRINYDDSVLYNHERLNKMKEFNHTIESFEELFRKNADVWKESEYIVNKLVKEFYRLEDELREKYLKVFINKYLRSKINITKLVTKLSSTKVKEKLAGFIIHVLKLYPALITDVFETGLWCAVKEFGRGDVISFNLEYFKKVILESSDRIESLYYFHILYLLSNNDISTFADIRAEKMNPLLYSLFIETFDIEVKYEDQTSISRNENWVKDYTTFLHSDKELNSENEIDNLFFNEAKKDNFRVIVGIDDLKCSFTCLEEMELYLQSFNK